MTRWWTVPAAAVVAMTLIGCGAVYLPDGAAPGASSPAARGAPPASSSASASTPSSGPASASTSAPVPAPTPASVAAAGAGSASATPARTGPVPPTAGSATGMAPQPAPQTVTLANDGQTVTMKVGQTFTLALGGPPPDWTVNVADPSILRQLPTFAATPGAQGLYGAEKAGTTTLTATSTYPCQRAHPACMIPSRAFWLTVVVEAN